MGWRTATTVAPGEPACSGPEAWGVWGAALTPPEYTVYMTRSHRTCALHGFSRQYARGLHSCRAVQVLPPARVVGDCPGPSTVQQLCGSRGMDSGR